MEKFDIYHFVSETYVWDKEFSPSNVLMASD